MRVPFTATGKGTDLWKTYYQKSKAEIIKILQKVLTMNFVNIDERDLLKSALNLYKVENLSLEDCYNLIYAKDNKAVSFKTFDIRLAKAFAS